MALMLMATGVSSAFAVWVGALTVAALGLASALTWATGPKRAVAILGLVLAILSYAAVPAHAFYLYWPHDCGWFWC